MDHCCEQWGYCWEPREYSEMLARDAVGYQGHCMSKLERGVVNYLIDHIRLNLDQFEEVC